MTNVIAFRPRRPKQELQQAFGNVSEKLNALIERELAEHPPRDWRDVLERARPRVTEEDYAACLTPE